MAVNDYNQRISPRMWFFGIILLIAAWLFIGFYPRIGTFEKTSVADVKKPVAISVTERYFDRTPHMEYGSAVNFLDKKKYWMFKFELYSDEGNDFDHVAYLSRFPQDAIWKFNAGDGQTGVKIFTNNPGEKARDGWIKVKNNRYD